jgi:hypothetical protein
MTLSIEAKKIYSQINNETTKMVNLKKLDKSIDLFAANLRGAS